MSQSSNNISAGNLQELRQILIKLNDKELDYLQSLINDKKVFAQEIAKILPESFLQSQKNGDGINMALVPVIENVLMESIAARPQIISDTLAPIIGKTIRKSINSEFRKIIDSVNMLVENTFSLRGLKWRYQALVTRKKYGEIVLLNTLGYTTDHVLLIHRETGLLLNEVSRSESFQKDPDLVSSMLKAIMDFAQDSIDSSSTIEAIEIGERKLFIETSQDSILATVLKGFPPATYKDKVISVSEDIQQKFSAQLKNFTGDTTPFVLSTPYLEKCLNLTDNNQPQSQGKTKKSWLSYLILTLIFAAICFWGISSFIASKRWNKYTESLQSTNGIYLTYSNKSHKNLVVKGMRLPESPSPLKLALDAGIDTSRLVSQWGFVVPLNTSYIKNQIKTAIYIPKTAQLYLDDKQICIKGIISKKTGQEIKSFIQKDLPNYELNLSQTNQISENDLNDLIHDIEAINLYYTFDTDSLTSDSKNQLSHFIEQTQKLRDYSDALQKNTKIIITGHSDNHGDNKINKKLSLDRAQQIGKVFIENNFNSKMLIIEGKGSKITKKENIPNEQKRRVDVEIRTDND
jgi:OOP family OmpA-OmpF porin